MNISEKVSIESIITGSSDHHQFSTNDGFQLSLKSEAQISLLLSLFTERGSCVGIYIDDFSFKSNNIVLFTPLLLGTVLFGLFHGVNPSHGWPIATLYSMRSKTPFVTGFICSSILASAHFVSSIIVVLAYILVSELIEIPQNYLQ